MQLGIFGPGLIGGSLALAARRLRLASRIAIWSPDPAERQLAAQLALGDVITGDLAEAAAGCDLAILCTPPAAMPALAEKLAPRLAADATLSDVASVKGDIAEALVRVGGARYVGSHPMAGAESTGLASARADLFDDTICLLTPHPGSRPAAAATLEDFWRGLGVRLRTMTAAEHDDAVALVSHLPHLMASALVASVAAQPGNPRECAGPGWRDTTRVAGGPAELWTEILSHNRAPVTRALHGAIAKLREAVDYLQAGREEELRRFLDEASRQKHKEG